MPSLVIDAPAVPLVPVQGSDAAFPVRRVYCIGRNYAAHAIEMGHDPDREPPFFFQKNPDNLDVGGSFVYPAAYERRAPRGRAGGGARQGRHEHPGRRGARPRLGLCGRARHDPARPAGDRQADGPALGDRQGVRGLGAGRPDAAGLGDRASRGRADPAQGQRRGAAGGRPQPDDLEGPGDDRLPVGVLRARAPATSS